MENIWNTLYDLIDNSLKRKDYEKARQIIDVGIKKACEVYIDPTFTIKQLKHQKRLIAALERTEK